MKHEDAQAVLAAYAAGALDPEEATAVEAHLAACGPCRAEVAVLRTTLDTLTAAVAEPDWEGHAAMREQFARRLATPAERPVPAVRQRPTGWARRRWGWAAAAVVAASGWAWAWHTAQEAARLQQLVALTTAGRPQALAPAADRRSLVDLYLHGGRAVVWVHRLTPAGAGHVYEGWWIVDGRPLPAGTFGRGPALLRRPAGAAAFAITIEPQGGTRQPTTPILAQTSV
jgi:anti-sigma-K factor RskA